MLQQLILPRISEFLQAHTGTVYLLDITVLLCIIICTLKAVSSIRLTCSSVMWALVLIFPVSVATTWFRMFKSEVAKQYKTTAGDLTLMCLTENQQTTTVRKIFNYWKHYFTFEDDRCATYYEQMIVTPLVKVSIMEALAVAVVQTVLKPLRIVGTEFSEFLKALVKDLPVQWQLISLISFTGIFAFVMMCAKGYRLNIPFIVCIEPSNTAPLLAPSSAQLAQINTSLSSISKMIHTHPPRRRVSSTATIKRRLKQH